MVVVLETGCGVGDLKCPPLWFCSFTNSILILYLLACHLRSPATKLQPLFTVIASRPSPVPFSSNEITFWLLPSVYLIKAQSFCSICLQLKRSTKKLFMEKEGGIWEHRVLVLLLVTGEQWTTINPRGSIKSGKEVTWVSPSPCHYCFFLVCLTLLLAILIQQWGFSDLFLL